MTAEVGSILGYLRLDRSDWDSELNAASRKADELAGHSPDIKIKTNAPTAIAQLASVAVAVKRLQDAQGAEAVAEKRLQDLRASGTASSGRLAAAENAVEKARRAQALATIQLAAANDANDTAVRKAAADTERAASNADRLGKSADSAKGPVIGLWGALAAVAPAAVPIAAVAVGAIAGLVPVAAAAVLGIKGITQEFQSGQLAGTKYQTDIQSLLGEFTNLKQTAANGLLGGVDQAIQSSQPLFAGLNQDIGMLSGQLGQIVAGAAPALLSILNALNPLFVTFGSLLADGATKLEHWTQSSSGVQSFVAYVQDQLPTVMQFLSNVIVLFGHLVAAAAPFGGVLLQGITAFVGALDAIPIQVLQAAVPLAVALYAAFKTYGFITLAVNGVSSAVRSLGAAAEAAAARQNAAELSMQAQAAATAETVAKAKADEAEAAAVSAASIAESITATNSILAEGAAASATAAAEFAAAMQAEAVAATEAAATIAAESAAAADAVVAEGEVASAGWAAMLGPIGAIGVGVALLATTFLHFGSTTSSNTAEVNALTQALQQDSGALGENTRAQVVHSLSSAGALENARKLGLNLNDVTNAALNGGPALKGLISYLQLLTVHTYGATKDTSAQTAAARELIATLSSENDTVKKSTQTYKDQQAALKASTTATQAQDTAAAALFGLTGTTGVAAYQAAKQAAYQSTQQSAAQTLQWQLENDAGSLLAQTLDKLAGKNLGYAQAQNSFDSALTNMGDHISSTGKKITFTTTSINDMSSASVQLRGQLLSQVTSAEQTSEAYGKMKGSSDAARTNLIRLRQQIIDNAAAHGVDRAAVTAYIDTVLKIPKKVPPTKLDVETAAAAAKTAALQKRIDALHGKTVVLKTVVSSMTVGNLQGTYNSQVPYAARHHASGGTIGDGPSGTVHGTGSPNVDSVMAMLAPGEEVIRASQANKHRALLKAINAGVPMTMSAPRATAPAAAQAAAVTGVAPVVYVQNPFTGEYLLAQVSSAATGVLRSQAREAALVGGRA